MASDHRRRISRMSHPKVTTAVVDEVSLRASRCFMRICCWSDLSNEAEVDVVEERYGNKDGVESTSVEAPGDDDEDKPSDGVRVVVVRLTRVPRWKRLLFLMMMRKSLMSHSWQSRTLMSHQPFIMSSEYSSRDGGASVVRIATWK